MSTTESAAPSPRQVTREDADRMLDEIDAAIGGGDPHFECHQELTPIELVQQVMSRTPASFDANALATLTRQVEALTGERDTLVRVLDTTTETRDRYARALEEIAGAQPGGVTWTGAEAGLQEIARAALAGKEVGSDGGR